MKFKVGDMVKVLIGKYKDKVSIVEDIDLDWELPYALEGIELLYKDDELELYIEVDKDKEKEPHVEKEKTDVDRYYLIVYNPASGQTLLFDPDEKLLIDEVFSVDPKDNSYFMGFFDAKSHNGETFVIKVQYLSQNKED